MDPSCLQHRLTEPERAIFEEKGFLQIEDALSPQQVSELTAAADSLHKRQLDAGAAKPEAPTSVTPRTSTRSSDSS